MMKTAIFVALVCVASANVVPGGRLNEHVRKFESLDLDPTLFFTRNRRDVSVVHQEKFEFPVEAFGKKFSLHMTPDHRINNADVKFQGLGEPETYDTTHLNYFHGHVAGDNTSFAHMRVLDDGTVWAGFGSEGEGYHIDPTHYHSDRKSGTGSNHVIYRTSDHNLFDPENPTVKPAHFSPDVNTFITPEEIKAAQMADVHKQVHQRQRRAAAYVTGKTACKIAVVADHTFFSGPGGGVASTSLDQVYARFQTMYDVFNPYNGNSFSSNPAILQIGSILIHQAKSAPAYNNIVTKDGQAFLEEFSKSDWSTVCVAHLLTNIDFDKGLLGLAWVGKPDNTIGGLCQSEVNSKWTNTGFTTSTNWGKSTGALLSGFVMAHETAHNFGSGHDPDTGTSAGDSGANGRFLMWPLAIDGSKPNNDNFSPNSLTEINAVIAAKGGCFVDFVAKVCGNGVQELDEVCDCGTGSATDCAAIDPCCSTFADGDVNNCKAKAGTECSPRHFINGVCCKTDCSFEAQGTVCRAAGECTKAVTCTAGGACPLGGAADVADNTMCKSQTNVCDGGECKKSVCELWTGYEECSLTGNKCTMACIKSGGTCTDVKDLGVTDVSYELTDGSGAINTNPGAITKPANSPCAFKGTDLTTGYCNDKSECVDGDSEGGIYDDLGDLVNSFVNLGAISDWLQKEAVSGVPNYAWIIIGVGVLFMVCACFCCGAKKKMSA